MKLKFFSVSLFILAFFLSSSTIFLSFAANNNDTQSCVPGTTCSSSMMSGGLQRTYVFHLPSTYLKTDRLPLILALHGGGGDGPGLENNILQGGFDKLADQDGFIIVYPNAMAKTWNSGSNPDSPSANVDDVKFVRNLIDYFVSQYQADRSRVYVTGMSSGGLMANRLACESADKIAAIAPVVAAMSKDIAASCKPSRHISVLMINGGSDPLIIWNSHEIKGPFGKSRGSRLTVPETQDKWVALNHIKTPPVFKMLPVKVKDGTQISENLFRGNDGTEVILYDELGAGHTWPGGKQYLPRLVIGQTSQNMDANKTIWDFFSRHSI